MRAPPSASPHLVVGVADPIPEPALAVIGLLQPQLPAIVRLRPPHPTTGAVVQATQACAGPLHLGRRQVTGDALDPYHGFEEFAICYAAALVIVISSPFRVRVKVPPVPASALNVTSLR